MLRIYGGLRGGRLPVCLISCVLAFVFCFLLSLTYLLAYLLSFVVSYFLQCLLACVLASTSFFPTCRLNWRHVLEKLSEQLCTYIHMHTHTHKHKHANGRKTRSSANLLNTTTIGRRPDILPNKPQKVQNYTTSITQDTSRPMHSGQRANQQHHHRLAFPDPLFLTSPIGATTRHCS